MNKEDMCSSTRQLDALMRETLDSQMWADATPGEITSLDDGKVVWPLKYREIKLRLQSLIGHLTVGQFEDVLNNWVFDVINNVLPRESPGEWRLASWTCVEDKKIKWAKKSNPNAVAWNRYAEGGSPGGGTPNPQKTTMYVVEEPAILIKAAFVDILQSEPADMWLMNTGKQGGPMSKYCLTRELKHLPKSERHQRDQAVELLAGQKAPDLADVSLDEETLEAARLLRTSGMKWGSIGKALHLPWQTIKAAIGEDNEAAT